MDKNRIHRILETFPENEYWVRSILERAEKKYGISLSGNIIDRADALLKYVLRSISHQEADAFPLEAMMELKNRYDWTFTFDTPSMREQIKKESAAVCSAWKRLHVLSEKQPLLLILNESTPTDYMTCFIPPTISIYQDTHRNISNRIWIYTGLKISSSHYRVPLEHSHEGHGLIRAVEAARRWNRTAVLCDFSRRRFPRSFLRVAEFSKVMGWGIHPMGKVYDPDALSLPNPKSSRGFPRKSGNPALYLYDPWPISDPEIVDKLTPSERTSFCGEPAAKPWQDDRIGARVEFKRNEDGSHRIQDHVWIVPTLEGWVRVDDLFKNRLARFVRKGYE